MKTLETVRATTCRTFSIVLLIDGVNIVKEIVLSRRFLQWKFLLSFI